MLFRSCLFAAPCISAFRILHDVLMCPFSLQWPHVTCLAFLLFSDPGFGLFPLFVPLLEVIGGSCSLSSSMESVASASVFSCPASAAITFVFMSCMHSIITLYASATGHARLHISAMLLMAPANLRVSSMLETSTASPNVGDRKSVV